MTEPEEGMTSEYVVLWFHPDGDKTKTFRETDRAHADPERRARAYAAKDDVAEWNPLLIHRITLVTEEILPL